MLGLGRRHVGDGGLELEPEIDRRIDELRDRGIGDVEFGGNLVERQADGKAILAHVQVPELVLQHDGHLVGETLAQIRRNRDTRGMGLEGDVEMVRAGQFAAALLDFAQHPADHRTQGFLDDGIIGDQAVGRVVAHAR